MLYSIAYNTYLVITLVKLLLGSALQDKRVSTHDSLGVENGKIHVLHWLIDNTALSCTPNTPGSVGGKIIWK